MTVLKRFFAIFLAATVLVAAGCTSTPTQESTGEYMDDSKITTKVKAAILNDPSLKVAEINVETYKRVVQLSGFVANSADIGRAGSVARSVNGVDKVVNDIRVK